MSHRETDDPELRLAITCAKWKVAAPINCANVLRLDIDANHTRSSGKAMVKSNQPPRCSPAWSKKPWRPRYHDAAPEPWREGRPTCNCLWRRGDFAVYYRFSSPFVRGVATSARAD